MSTQFVEGMYVRFGIDDDRADLNYRDYRIGQIARIDWTAHAATVVLRDQTEWRLRLDLDRLQRCRILPDTEARHVITNQSVRVLMPSDDDFTAGELLAYYVEVNDRVERLTENVLAVPAHRQDVDPFDQLRRYELHQPIWLSQRNAVVKGIGDLRTATFGLEDLVGSRILLLAHQAEVVAEVLSSPQCRYILGDEVGLGKTIEASVILRGLRRRHQGMRTLIVVPSSLLEQWHRELDKKFWLDFPVLGQGARESRFNARDNLGAITSAESLSGDWAVGARVSGEAWGLLIVDEAHHLRKDPVLFERLRTLSEHAARVLLLSATPIQRRAEEYLALLALMDPARYHPDDLAGFEKMLRLQHSIREFTSYHSRGLDPDIFEADQFITGLTPIVEEVGRDRVLKRLAERVAERRDDEQKCITAATSVLAYLSENYRIERRVIRNRRAHLAIAGQVELPTRSLDMSYSYDPGREEVFALDALLEYLTTYTRVHRDHPLAGEYCRVLLHAAGSSPFALASVLQDRLAGLGRGSVPHEVAHRLHTLAMPAAPRHERERVRELAGVLPAIDGEAAVLEDVLRTVVRWRDAAIGWLQDIDRAVPDEGTSGAGRLAQVLRAINDAVQASSGLKVLLFTGWPETLEALKGALARRYRRGTSELLAEFHNGMDSTALQDAATRFQENRRCQILLCDELGGEGRNFQAADRIVHVDLPWTPAQLEQRIGRVDRFGRTGTVCSIVPFARDWPEHDLFRIWNEAFALFTSSMSGMEIMLEGIQDELISGLLASPRDGLRQLVDHFARQAGDLRKEVEKERKFEQPAVNKTRRAAFAALAEQYSDGERLRRPILGWATLAGLHSDYMPAIQIVSFDPKDFSEASMANAKVSQLPDMQEALQRSLRPYELVIRGTFSRKRAVLWEDVVFFAPGTDRWTDGLIANALEADRGRCCAILRAAPALPKDQLVFEILFGLSVDPRPLYALGYGPVHLYRAQGYMRMATLSILVSANGTVMDREAPEAQVVKKPYEKAADKHLGKRDEPDAFLQQFRAVLPPDQWEPLVRDVSRTARHHVNKLLARADDLATRAENEFKRHALGWHAAQHFLAGTADAVSAEIAEYEQISAALVAGIRTPLVRLESVCCWWLRAGARK